MSGYLAAAGDRGALGRFWSYESMLRGLESRVDSLVGVTGAVYVLRASAWVPLKEGLINDDLVVPLQARREGPDPALSGRRGPRSQEVHPGSAVCPAGPDPHRGLPAARLVPVGRGSLAQPAVDRVPLPQGRPPAHPLPARRGGAGHCHSRVTRNAAGDRGGAPRRAGRSRASRPGRGRRSARSPGHCAFSSWR